MSEIFFKSELERSEKIGTFWRCPALLIVETTINQPQMKILRRPATWNGIPADFFVMCVPKNINGERAKR